MRRHKPRPESAELRHTANNVSRWPRGADWFPIMRGKGAAGQEIKRNDKVAEATAAQKRNEKSAGGSVRHPPTASTFPSSSLTGNVTMYLLLKYRALYSTTFASLWRSTLISAAGLHRLLSHPPTAVCCWHTAALRRGKPEIVQTWDTEAHPRDTQR